MARRSRTLRVGTRGSQLALAQTQLAVDALKALHPNLVVKIIPIRTKGDRISSTAELRTAGKGLFVKEIELALLRRKIDVAVHSMKDMPSILPDGLVIAAFPERGEAADAFVTSDGRSIDQVPPGAVIGTSSLRRQSQMRKYYSHLKITEMKGNLDTRIETMRNPRTKVSGIVVAAAGVQRLFHNNGVPHQILPKDRFVPAPGQGALCLECREDKEDILKLLAPLNHEETEACVRAERALMGRLEGGCQIPLGAHATVIQDTFERFLRLTGYLALPDGSKAVTAEATGALDDPEGVAAGLETMLRARGATEILAALAPGRARRLAPSRNGRPRARAKSRRPARKSSRRR